MSFVSNLAHSLVIEWKMSTILTKMLCRIQNGRTLQKRHICMQNKLHAEQFSLFLFTGEHNQYISRSRTFGSYYEIWSGFWFITSVCLINILPNISIGSVKFSLQKHGFSPAITKKGNQFNLISIEQYATSHQYPMLVLLNMTNILYQSRKHLIGTVPLSQCNEVHMHIVEGSHHKKKQYLSIKQIWVVCPHTSTYSFSVSACNYYFNHF